MTTNKYKTKKMYVAVHEGLLTSLVVFHRLLLEVLEDVWPELPLQAVAVVPEQALQPVPAENTHTR